MAAYFWFSLSSLASLSLPQVGCSCDFRALPCCLILQVETNDYKYLRSGKPKALNNSVKSRQSGNYCTKPSNNDSRWWGASESRSRQKDALGETQMATGADQNEDEEEEQERLSYVLKLNILQKSAKIEMGNHDRHHRCLLTDVRLKLRERSLQDAAIIVLQRRKYKTERHY